LRQRIADEKDRTAFAATLTSAMNSLTYICSSHAHNITNTQ
jgi:hypothetical protein